MWNTHEDVNPEVFPNKCFVLKTLWQESRTDSGGTPTTAEDSILQHDYAKAGICIGFWGV